MELREELKSLAEEKGIKAGMAKKGQSENKSDTPPESNASLSHTAPVLQRLFEGMKPVDLVKTLMEKIGDPLDRYRDADGNLQTKKIPQKLWIVALVYEIMEAAKDMDLALCVRHGAIYGYSATHWQEIGDDEVKKILSLMAIRLGFHSPAEARTSDFREKLFKQFVADGLEEAPSPDRNRITLINLRNGTLEIEGHDVRLREHRREDFLTYCLNYDYDPKADAPIFSRYLKRVLPEPESQAIIQEFLGYAFTSGIKLEKVLVLLGSGRNGKSVLFEIVTELMGPENISHKGLGEICQKGDRGNGHRAEVENKLLNYASELNPVGADVDLFKAIVSQEPVTARRLYKDAFTYRPTVKLIFNANKLPVESERTTAYFRRFMIVPFEVTITDEEMDIELHRKIIDNELPGVLNWIIEGLKRVSTAKHFTSSPKSDQALETYKKESNSVAQFVEEYRLIPDPYGFVPNAELYRSYSEFCNESGYKRLSKANFGKEMKSLGFEALRREWHGKSTRGFLADFGAQ